MFEPLQIPHLNSNTEPIVDLFRLEQKWQLTGTTPNILGVDASLFRLGFLYRLKLGGKCIEIPIDFLKFIKNPILV